MSVLPMLGYTYLPTKNGFRGQSSKTIWMYKRTENTSQMVIFANNL